MYELKWKELKVNEVPPPYSIPIEGQTTVTYRVLQYRQQEEDWGGQNEHPDMVWPKWQDVPFST